MEIELEPRVKPLGYKVKGMSRESPTQKATNVLDPDLRSHWSTATNTKEWILLELDVCSITTINHKLYNIYIYTYTFMGLLHNSIVVMGLVFLERFLKKTS